MTADQIATFDSEESWRSWLETHHHEATGIWLRLAKKNAPFSTVTYAAAVEVALCYGWIDGQKKPQSKESWLQRFSPRTSKSVWSKINREKAVALIADGRMKAPGLAAIEKAKESGRWDGAYDSPASASVPADLEAAFLANPSAYAFFMKLDRANRYAVLWRVQTAKRPETRARRIAQLVAMLAQGRKVHE